LNPIEKLWRMFSAILLVAVTFGFSVPALTLLLDGGRGIDAIAMGVMMSVAASPFVAVIGFGIALPIATFARAIGIRGWLAYGLLGSMVGAAIWYALLVLFGGWTLNEIAPQAAVWGVLPGLVGGLYWWGAVDRHQNRNSWTEWA
jgi:hypothetical protein